MLQHLFSLVGMSEGVDVGVGVGVGAGAGLGVRVYVRERKERRGETKKELEVCKSGKLLSGDRRHWHLTAGCECDVRLAV